MYDALELCTGISRDERCKSVKGCDEKDLFIICACVCAYNT